MHICFMSTIITGEEEWKGIKEEKNNRKYTKKMYTPCTTIVFVNGDHSSINLFSSNFSHNSQSSLNVSNKQHRAGQR